MVFCRILSVFIEWNWWLLDGEGLWFVWENFLVFMVCLEFNLDYGGLVFVIINKYGMKMLCFKGVIWNGRKEWDKFGIFFF